MKPQKITVLLPIKGMSERLENKNFKLFCGKPLYQHIIGTLQNADIVKEIIINTDSEIIAKECKEHFSKVRIIDRPEHILGNHITMNTIIEYDLTQTEEEHFLQTHVTNPLLSESSIVEAVTQYFEQLDQYDSLFSVTKIQKRAYDKDGNAINHSNKVLEQTQHLPPVLIENSNMFIFSRSSFEANDKSRIGLKPNPYWMHEIESMDIDYEEDFKLAELICNNKDLFPSVLDRLP